MLLHFSCPYEKVHKQSTKKYSGTHVEKRQKSNNVRDGSKTLPQCGYFLVYFQSFWTVL